MMIHLEVAGRLEQEGPGRADRGDAPVGEHPLHARLGEIGRLLGAQLPRQHAPEIAVGGDQLVERFFDQTARPPARVAAVAIEAALG